MQTFQELITAEMAAAGYSDAEVSAALNKILAHEKLGPKLNALVKTATEDYNAQAGRIRQYQDWYPKAQAEYDRMLAENKRVTAELEALRNGGGQPAFDASNYVSKQDLVNMQLDMGKRYAGVIKETAAITASHVSRFKDQPDFEAIDKIATEQGIPLRMAYEKYIEPRVKEAEKQANEEWKKQQREEIERDVRSRYQLPAEEKPQEKSPMAAARSHKPEDTPKDMDAELLDAWHSVPAKA